MARRRKQGAKERTGRVVETRGRKVLVRDDDGERDCWRSGQKAVVGDRVRWVPAQGSGGKLVAIEPRRTVLRRMDLRGREQVLAANLRGLLVVASTREPGFRPALIHRYFAAAWREGLEIALVLNKIDLGVPEAVDAHLDLLGDELRVLRVSATTGQGLDDLRAFFAAERESGPWALVGGSGVGKTSLIAALLPAADVGAIGDISEYWGTGRHTTTHSRLFELPRGGELVDSPGIRNLTPVFDDPVALRQHFPVVRHVHCKYRNCRHREGEEGCNLEAEVPAPLVASYRHLLNEVTEAVEAKRPG